MLTFASHGVCRVSSNETAESLEEIFEAPFFGRSPRPKKLLKTRTPRSHWIPRRNERKEKKKKKKNKKIVSLIQTFYLTCVYRADFFLAKKNNISFGFVKCENRFWVVEWMMIKKWKKHVLSLMRRLWNCKTNKKFLWLCQNLQKKIKGWQ
jgi:hypothetical protein